MITSPKGRADLTADREPLEGMEKVHAKFAHLREAKRRAEAEKHARAELAETF